MLPGRPRFVFWAAAAAAALAAVAAAAAAAAGDDCGSFGATCGEDAGEGDLSALLQLSASLEQAPAAPAPADAAAAAAAAAARKEAAAEAVAKAVAAAVAAAGVAGQGQAANGTFLADALPEEEDLDEEITELAKLGVLPLLTTMMGAFLVSGVVAKRTALVPEAFCIMAMAVVLGFMYRYRIGAEAFPKYTASRFIFFDTAFMSYLLWPGVVFEGAWRCSMPHLLGQLPSVVLFAALGSLTSAFLIARAGMVLHGMGWDTVGSWRANFASGVVLSATEPTAALSMFTKLKLHEERPWLVELIMGESMINTGIAVVYLGVVNTMDAQPQFQVLAQEMVIMFIGSMCLGALGGLALGLPMKLGNFTGEASSEVFYVVFCPYLIYGLANTMMLSGTIACLFAGIVMKHVSSAIFSENGFRATGGFLESWANFAGAFIFILCGVSVAFIRFEHFSFCFIGLCLCFVSRAIVVMACGWMANVLRICSRTQELDLISWKDQVIMSLSGTRGGITLLMALWIDEGWCGQEEKTKIVTTAFFAVCSLLILFGGATGPCLRYLEMVQSKGASTQKSG